MLVTDLFCTFWCSPTHVRASREQGGNGFWEKDLLRLKRRAGAIEKDTAILLSWLPGYLTCELCESIGSGREGGVEQSTRGDFWNEQEGGSVGRKKTSFLLYLKFVGLSTKI